MEKRQGEKKKEITGKKKGGYQGAWATEKGD